MQVKLKFIMLLVIAAFSLAFAQGEVAKEALTIDFGDFQTQAELTYPAQGNGPFPTVVLIHGSGPEDMNAAIFGFGADNQPVLLSSIFGDISDHLSAHGFAVLRYNKHYVTGPGEADFRKFYTQLDLPQMLADAEKVLDAAEANPKVDKQRVFLYGWSEGSTVAAALAAKRPELAGLIVQGPVVEPWRDLFLYQILDVGLPYVRQVSPDEQVTVDTLRTLQAGDGGMVAKGILYYIGDPVSLQQGKLAINPALDTNRDGTLEADELTLEALETLVDGHFSPQGFAAIYTPERALPDLGEQAPNLTMPVLILQGANDANVPASGAQALNAELERVGNPDHTLNLYPGLGHSLGETRSVITDNFEPIAQPPLENLVAWLEARSGGNSGRTGVQSGGAGGDGDSGGDTGGYSGG